MHPTRMNQETGRILETCAKDWESSTPETKTPMNSYWGGWGRGWGWIMRDRWNKSGPGRTGSTHGQEVKSLGPEQRWVFNNNNNRKPLWMRDKTRGQTRPRDRRQIWHHAGSEPVTPEPPSWNENPFISIRSRKRHCFHPLCPLSLCDCHFYFEVLFITLYPVKIYVFA